MTFRPALLACLSLLVAVTLASPPAQAQKMRDEIAVTARNLSTPDLCAEKDNIQIDFASAAVKTFRVQATHPSYIGMIVTDRYQPDFSSCSFYTDEKFGDAGQRITLYETPDLQLVGYKLPTFWRPAETPIRIGDKTFQGIHAFQLWIKHRERAEEILVFYPPDGYWRIRPLPFADMRWTAYGSSFLIGPVEIKERPIVDVREVTFDPAAKTFALAFRRGGSATLKLEKVDQDHLSLDVALDGLPANLPFAALRSMYTTEANSDAARVAWRTKGGEAWREEPIMTFPTSEVTEFWAGRRIPSRHNLSAPDMSFGRFSAAPAK